MRRVLRRSSVGQPFGAAGGWAATLTAALLLCAAPVVAYVKFGLDVAGQNVVLRWPDLPVRYRVSDANLPGLAAADFAAVVQRAFATWEQAPGARASASHAGFTSARPSDDDAENVLGFEARPDLDRTLATTTYTIDTVSGRIIEADIAFNAAQPWSIAQGGEPGRYDLESIALHEIGHLFGLGHSALGETELVAGGRRRVQALGAIMFPIAFPAGSVEGRVLRDDDIAGLSDLYPAPDGAVRGSLSGTVTRDGRGLFGAHVVAYHLRSGQLVGGFTVNDSGEFVIAGLEPGPCVVRVEPLDDGDVESFFDGSTVIDTNFAVTYAQRLVVVPRDGNAGGVTIAVRAR